MTMLAGLMALMPEILWEACTHVYYTFLKAVLPWPSKR